MEKIILAYCRDNTDLAETIDQQLSRVGIPFEHVTNRPGAMPGQFAAWVQSSAAPAILIITDNFLRDKNCMASALEMVQSLIRHNRLLTVVAKGWQKDSSSALVGTAVETKFERVVDAIQYLNFWQNSYIDIANKDQSTEGTDYRIVKEISTQVGDLLNTLRDYGYCRLEDFSADDYALFFKKFGIEAWHSQFQQMVHSQEDAMPQSTIKGDAEHRPELKKQEKTEEKEQKMVENESNQEIIEEKENLAVAEQNVAFVVPTPVKPPKNGEPVALSSQQFSEMDAMLEELVKEENSGLQADEDDSIDAILDEFQNGFVAEKSTIKQDSQPEISHEMNKEESAPIYPKITATEPPKNPSKNADEIKSDAAYWFGKGDADTGIKVLEMALDGSPQQHDIRLEYAKALLEKKGDHEAAHLQLEKLMASGYFNVEAYNLMGDVAFAKGDYLMAKNCWDKVSQLEPGFPNIFIKLGDLSAKHFRGFKSNAAKYFEKAVEQDPQDATAFYKNGALLLEHLNRPKKAARFLLQALNIDPKNARAWSDLAIAYHHLGDALFLLPQVEEKTSSEKQLTILITGATSGIGRATAELFAKNGHRVILTGRRAERLENMQADFKEKYKKSDCKILNFDVRDRKSTEDILKNLPDDWKNIDILLNNAGLAKGFDPIQEGSFEHWDIMIDTNLKGLLNVTRFVAPWMVARQKGHIINIGSSAGKEAYGKGAVYCATKFGVDALTKAMRIDLHQHNIRVSQISPGHVEETEFALTRFDGDSQKAKIYEDFQPLKSSDVADAVYYAVTRPAHVNIQDIYLFGTQQANATTIDRSGR